MEGRSCRLLCLHRLLEIEDRPLKFSECKVCVLTFSIGIYFTIDVLLIICPFFLLKKNVVSIWIFDTT